MFWTGAPRWLYVPIYIALGWAAVFYLPAFFAPASAAVIILLVGRRAALHARRRRLRLQRPDPSPRWFGFHEVFHTLTIAAFVTHYVGVSIATYSLR